MWNSSVKNLHELYLRAIDYASDLANWDIERISETCMAYTESSLEDYMTVNFENLEIDDLTINQSQRLLLVGFSIEESLGRMIEWLSDNFDMAINAVILNYVKTENGSELLSRTVTIPEEIDKKKSQSKISSKLRCRTNQGNMRLIS